MKEKILFKGAEADIYEIKNLIVKDRKSKPYRLKEIDERIRKSRTKSEAKIIGKLSKFIPVPKILEVNNFRITMENIEGKKLSEFLDKFNEKKQKEILKQI